ncbi:MAG: VWA domain-containing protein [Pseudomonadota bacterium]
MIHFEWPWLLVMLPLPWIYRRFLSPMPPSEGAALRVPRLQDFAQPGAGTYSHDLRRWPLWIAAVAWLLLVSASARPQWLGDLIQLPVSGRDLMLAVDLSGSMQERDFLIGGKTVDRLTATKRVAGEFIQKREGDRIGLILFGEQAYSQTPLTFDRQTVRILLQEAVIGLAGRATAIGDAIGLAVKRLRRREESQRVLILLTDGANTAGEVTPLDAADLAAREGLKIYTIGIGADKMMVRDLFGTRYVNPSTELDEKTLTTIAEKTGGRYFRAKNTQQLQEIYGHLDKLEPVEQDAQSFRPKTALFPWPLSGACPAPPL